MKLQEHFRHKGAIHFGSIDLADVKQVKVPDATAEASFTLIGILLPSSPPFKIHDVT